MTTPADPPHHVDEDVAATYDADSATRSSPEVPGSTIDLLAGLAADGAALELAVGTGRVALPPAACPCTGSSSPRRWRRGCGPGTPAGRSASPSAT
ncbi:hypothetical protein [Luteimicrobium sp. DT211]|uniref:hypothetical protein n=1 Tax=Luteimicrobium sp. DT211 TaxID=3393412 RepID=UPI003CFBB68B